ncbi:MAG: ribosomal protein S18-alanine N-acetyltransferase [Betaproteobacteria bacterium]
MNARLDLLPGQRPAPLPPLHAMAVADVDAVLGVEVRAYAYPWSRGNFVDSLAAGYRARLARDAAGAVLGYFIAMPGVGELHLLNLTVAPEHQGRGLGRALLEAVVAEARALPAARLLLLEVRDGNERARRLYAARGFAEVGRRRGYYPARGGREDAVVMSLALEQSDGLD